jgi:hypothetical protein
MDKGHADPEYSGYAPKNMKKFEKEERRDEIRPMNRAKQSRDFGMGKVLFVLQS